MNSQVSLNEAYRVLVDRNVVYERLGQSEATDTLLRELSGPFLIAADEQYEASKLKAVVVGQANDGWLEGNYFQFLEHGNIEAALKVYREFNIASYGPGTFGRYFAEIRNKLLGKHDLTTERAVVYSNLFKLNQGMMQMSDSPHAEAIMKLQEGVFQKEISILQPNAVIFLTGPNYDDTIKAFFPDAERIALDGFSEGEVARIASSTLPELSFRSYHPGFVNRDRSNRIRFYDAIIEQIRAATP